MDLNHQQLLMKFEELGIIKHGHFKLTSGKHSGIFCNKDAINQHPTLRKFIQMELLTLTIQLIKSQADHTPIGLGDLIITGPAVSGAIWALPVADALNFSFVYPEKSIGISGDDIMVFKRGYNNAIKGKSVVIIKDIISTGKSINLTAAVIQRCGGKVVGTVAIWNRSGITFDFPSNSIINQHVDMWDQKECPLCRNNIPLADPKTDEVIVNNPMTIIFSEPLPS